MPAPSEGRGVWRGRLGVDLQSIWFCPVDSAGAFSFRIEAIGAMNIARRAAQATRSPKRSFFAKSARMVGLNEEAELNLRWALSHARKETYTQWRQKRVSPDSHRPAPALAIDIVLHLGPGQETDALETVRTLQAQTDGDWRVIFTGDDDTAKKVRASCADARVQPHPIERRSDWVAFLAAGDRMAPHMLACLAAHLERNPEHDVVYVDEAPYSATSQPIFKPDWSPTRQSYAPYVGRAAAIRRIIAERQNLFAFPQPDQTVDKALAATSENAVGHIARALFAARPVAPPAPRGEWRAIATERTIGVVIPTRDRLDVLAPCLKSMFAVTDYPHFRVLVVDNGSVERRTRLALAELTRTERRLRVVRAPGPFNFSSLCNFGAARLACDYLMFLNNDTVILQPDWLAKMAHMAAQPDIGAVGAKLLHLDRRVQHAGVVLGLGGVAGHFGAGLKREAEGWLGANIAPHEVSAVTAACLMVDKRKFDAIGGFDAVNLPVELNDVDLCLRLAERDWRAICDCRVELLHRQSASRGGSALRLQKVYAEERAYFTTRWRRTIHNDPFFNPNLSLYDYTPRLA